MPETTDRTLDLAAQAIRAGRPQEAERLARGVLTSDWGNVFAANALAWALLMQDRPGDAVEPLRKAVGQTGDPETLTLLARALIASGREADGMVQLRTAVARRPVYPMAFLELGGRLVDGGEVDEGIAMLESGLALTPGSVMLTLGLGHAYLAQHDMPAARARFEAVLAVEPGRPDALASLAKVLALEGDFARAADGYAQALATRPDDAATALELAKCLLEVNRREQGEALLRSLAKASPKLAGLAITALSGAPHGRAFLRPNQASRFLDL